MPNIDLGSIQTPTKNPKRVFRNTPYTRWDIKPNGRRFIATKEKYYRRLKYNRSDVDPLKGLLPLKDEPLNHKKALQRNHNIFH